MTETIDTEIHGDCLCFYNVFDSNPDPAWRIDYYSGHKTEQELKEMVYTSHAKRYMEYLTIVVNCDKKQMNIKVHASSDPDILWNAFIQKRDELKNACIQEFGQAYKSHFNKNLPRYKEGV